jgi:hypothetical protein
MKVKPFIIFTIMFISVPIDATFLVVLIIGRIIVWIVETIKEKKIEYMIINKSNIIENLKSINSTYNALIDNSINDYYIVTTVGKHKYVKMLAEVKNGNEIIIYETTDKADIKLLKEFAKIYNLKTFSSVEEYKQETEKAERKEDKIKIIIVIFLTLLLYGFVIYKVW